MKNYLRCMRLKRVFPFGSRIPRIKTDLLVEASAFLIFNFSGDGNSRDYPDSELLPTGASGHCPRSAGLRSGMDWNLVETRRIGVRRSNLACGIAGQCPDAPLPTHFPLGTRAPVFLDS